MSNLDSTTQGMTSTFIAKFGDFIALYRGVERIWIGPDGPSTQYNEPGILYAEMIDGVIQTLGPVSDYNYAVAHGYTGTMAEWVQLLLDAHQEAADAAASASAALASEQAAATSETNASTSETNASNSASAAASSQQAAEQWATGGTSGTPTATNNAKYYAEKSQAESERVRNMTVAAETLFPTSEATVNVTTASNHYDLLFGIPKGEKGDPNYLAIMPSGDGLVCTWTEDHEALSAKTIMFDPYVQTPVTIYEMLQPITNDQIDALFA